MSNSKNRLQEAEQIISMIRQLVDIVKDDTLPEEEADQLVGRLLVKLDHGIQRYDQGLDPLGSSHIKDKLEMEPKPKRKKP